MRTLYANSNQKPSLVDIPSVTITSTWTVGDMQVYKEDIPNTLHLPDNVTHTVPSTIIVASCKISLHVM